MSRSDVDVNPVTFSRLISHGLDVGGLNPASKLQADVSFAQSIAFYLRYFALHLLYLWIYIYDNLAYHYHRLKIRIMMISYHHNRTPQLIRNDVVGLAKIPNHVATLLNLKDPSVEGGGIDGLLEDCGEIAAWCVGCGIRQFTVYEKTGALKDLPSADVYRAISRKLETYFGTTSCPKFALITPHKAFVFADGKQATSPVPIDEYQLVINLLSIEDGRETIVDLTKTLANLAVKHKLSPKEITTEVINSEMESLVTREPDILIIFGPRIDLQGFPPWQIRFSEIFYQPDNDEVTYPVFLKGLERYAACQINVGK